MLTAQNIHKNYGQLKVLNGVNLHIEKGQRVAIVGKSGAGKSTLLHILGTLDYPDQGQVTIDGKVVNTLKNKELANFRNQKVGFVFQFHHLLQEFTALENTIIPGLIQQKPLSQLTEEAKKLLGYLGLGDRLDHKPNQMSGGEQQRVAVARALINKPTVLFADEPTGNLDTYNSEELHKLFIRMSHDFHLTMVIVTHNQELAGQCDRILTMQDGQLI